MDILRCGSQASREGEAGQFCGRVRIDSLFGADRPARTTVGTVTFEPGARTAWHEHPLGQILIVTAGCGRIQRAGGAVETIFAGDLVWIAPGERHWHGAGTDTAMTHIAIQEQQDGSAVRWHEAVDESVQGG